MLARRAAFGPITVTRYGKTATIHAEAITCLWHGVFGPRRVQVLLIRDVSATGYDLALVTSPGYWRAARMLRGSRVAPSRDLQEVSMVPGRYRASW
jgi:hypothetical protein